MAWVAGCSHRWIVVGVLLALVGAAAPAVAETRVALVIGNGAYKHLTRLPNPAGDAELMAATLKSLGFRLIGDGPQTDVDKPTFERLIRRFGQELTGESVGIFYYAGHGLQVQGVNFLVPVDANPVSVTDTDFELIDAGLALKQMEGAGSRLNIVILDACRNNPFGGRGMRDVGSGLAVMRAPRGTIISYATQPGNVARDGTDGHSPYSRALAESMTRPGNRVLDVFNEVGLKVDKATRGEQQPWVSSSPIEGEFYFTKENSSPSAAVAAAVPAAPLPGDAELLFWQSIAGSTTPADFDAYLRHYPQGRFVDLARNRLLALNQPAKLPVSPPQPDPAAIRAPHPAALRENCAPVRDMPGVREYCASSVLPAAVGDRSGQSVYYVSNLFDGNPATAWARARSQYGNAWILAEFAGERLVTAITIANGYQKSQDSYQNNDRVRLLRLLSSTGQTATLRIADRPGTQQISVDPPLRGEWLQLIVEDVVSGARSPDLTISELAIVSTAAR